MLMPLQQKVRDIISDKSIKPIKTFIIVGGAYGSVGSSFTMHFNPDYFGTATSLLQSNRHIKEILEEDDGLFIIANASRVKKSYNSEDVHKHGRLAKVIQPNVAIDTGPIFSFNAETVPYYYSGHTTIVDEVEITSYDPQTKRSKFNLIDIEEDINYSDFAAFRHEASKAAQKFDRHILAHQLKHMESPIELTNLIYDVCLLTELIIPEGDNRKPRQFFATNKLSNRIRMLHEILVEFNQGNITEHGGLKV